MKMGYWKFASKMGYTSITGYPKTFTNPYLMRHQKDSICTTTSSPFIVATKSDNAVSPAVRLSRLVVVKWKSYQPFPRKGEAMNVHAYKDALELTKLILENNSTLLIPSEKTANTQAKHLSAFVQTLTKELASIRSSKPD
jgi:hypothetical protein